MQINGKKIRTEREMFIQINAGKRWVSGRGARIMVDGHGNPRPPKVVLHGEVAMQINGKKIGTEREMFIQINTGKRWMFGQGARIMVDAHGNPRPPKVVLRGFSLR